MCCRNTWFYFRKYMNQKQRTPTCITCIIYNAFVPHTHTKSNNMFHNYFLVDLYEEEYHAWGVSPPNIAALKIAKKHCNCFWNNHHLFPYTVVAQHARKWLWLVHIPLLHWWLSTVNERHCLLLFSQKPMVYDSALSCLTPPRIQPKHQATIVHQYVWLSNDIIQYDGTHHQSFILHYPPPMIWWWVMPTLAINKPVSH